MAWGKIMFGSAIVWVLMLVSFFHQLSPGQSLHFGHYFWLIVGAVFIVRAGKKYFCPPSVIGQSPYLERCARARRLKRLSQGWETPSPSRRQYVRGQ